MIKQVVKFEALGQTFDTREEAVVNLGPELLERLLDALVMKPTTEKHLKLELTERVEEFRIMAEAAEILAAGSKPIRKVCRPFGVTDEELTVEPYRMSDALAAGVEAAKFWKPTAFPAGSNEAKFMEHRKTGEVQHLTVIDGTASGRIKYLGDAYVKETEETLEAFQFISLARKSKKTREDIKGLEALADSLGLLGIAVKGF